MGMSISLHILDKDKLVDAIHEHVVKNGGFREGALDARSFVEVLAPEFGAVTGDKLYQVWNEYYEDYNPASEFYQAVDEYYFPNHTDEDGPKGYWDGFFFSGYSSLEGVNAAEVLEELFPDDFGWENGRFINE